MIDLELYRDRLFSVHLGMLVAATVGTLTNESGSQSVLEFILKLQFDSIFRSELDASFYRHLEQIKAVTTQENQLTPYTVSMIICLFLSQATRLDYLSESIIDSHWKFLEELPPPATELFWVKALGYPFTSDSETVTLGGYQICFLDGLRGIYHVPSLSWVLSFEYYEKPE